MKIKKVNQIKKVYRILAKFLQFAIARTISPLIRRLGINIIPEFSKINFLSYEYSPNTRRLVFNTDKRKSFNKVFIDTSLSSTNLCYLGKKFPTNKSSISLEGHRSGYTAVYTILFTQFFNKDITLAEIGIEKNNSIKMWRNYFKKAKIHALEFDENKIRDAKKHKLKNTYYHKVDVHSEKSIANSFKKIGCKFDIIIDDSTHIFEDQIRIVKNSYKFLKKNGILIIEDIYKFRKEHSEENYFNKLKNLKRYFRDIVFIECNHINNFTASWKCEKILLLVRNNRN